MPPKAFSGRHRSDLTQSATSRQRTCSANTREFPELNIGGPDAQVTVIAWFKREPSEYRGWQFIAGVWNEHGGRQYGLFLNLNIHDSAEKVGAHVSKHGGATPGYPYCMDAAIGPTRVDLERWHCAAMVYDGKIAMSFLDGRLDIREPQGEPGRNPFAYPGGLFASGADSTVGAVSRPACVEAVEDGKFHESGSLIATPLVGLLGGLAIFNRALGANDIAAVSQFRVQVADE